MLFYFKDMLKWQSGTINNRNINLYSDISAKSTAIINTNN